jgi:site-specific DNA-methyltransferase (adenine-specific)
MKTMKLSAIKIDKEYLGLVFRPNADDYAALKASIAQDGIRLPLIIDQHGALVDGHTRRQIAEELGLKNVPIDVHRFADREETKRFILQSNLRRDLNTAQKAELALKRLAAAKAQGRAVDPNLESVGVGFITLSKVQRIKAAMTTYPELKSSWRQALSGNDTVHGVYQRMQVMKDKEAEQEEIERAAKDPAIVHARSQLPLDEVIHGDCLEILKTWPEASVNFIFTSPPYANARETTYGGVLPKDYVNWFLPRADQFLRVLAEDGSFVLNIKEGLDEGERSAYVYELVLALRSRGWRLVDEYIWCKRNAIPGRWPDRLQDRWEHLYHFTRSRKFRMFRDAVREPIGDWAKNRIGKASDRDRSITRPRSRSGFGGMRAAGLAEKSLIYPCNVIHLATEGGMFRSHSAIFPERLPAWFIRLFTLEGDVVLDPFLGSGTTAVAALNLKRRYIGVDLYAPYLKTARERIKVASVRFAKDGTPNAYFLPVSRSGRNEE